MLSTQTLTGVPDVCTQGSDGSRHVSTGLAEASSHDIGHQEATRLRCQCVIRRAGHMAY